VLRCGPASAAAVEFPRDREQVTGAVEVDGQEVSSSVCRAWACSIAHLRRVLGRPGTGSPTRVRAAERGWSQAQLAALLGVSRQTVNALERGKYDPSLPLAFRISRLFQLPIEAIFDPGPSGAT
jgi:putative transcriptional regulator